MVTVSKFKDPRYTGENRCIPCTAVNAVLAVVLGIALGAGVFVLTQQGGLATGFAGLTILISATAIFFKGYLVPGTPTLTKRYFPDRVLAWFDKGPSSEPTQQNERGSVDVEAVLNEANVLEVCDEGRDLCLQGWFARAWSDEMATIDSKAENHRELLAALIEVEADEMEFNDFGSAFVASIDGRRIGQWESEPAFKADMGAARVLDREYNCWDRLTAYEKGQVLNGLRVFLEECPSCGGAVHFGEETVESCCMERDVAAVTCQECGSRLFEAPIPDGKVPAA